MAGYKQGLDNGNMQKPERGTVQKAEGRTCIDFEALYDKGENPHRQTTISPQEVTRAGKCTKQPHWQWGEDTDGGRWNKGNGEDY